MGDELLVLEHLALGLRDHVRKPFALGHQHERTSARRSATTYEPAIPGSVNVTFTAFSFTLVIVAPATTWSHRDSCTHGCPTIIQTLSGEHPPHRSAPRERGGALLAALHAAIVSSTDSLSGASCTAGVSETNSQHLAQRIDHVLARLLAGLPLADRPTYLGDPREHPSVPRVLVNDGQSKRFAHNRHGTGASDCSGNVRTSFVIQMARCRHAAAPFNDGAPAPRGERARRVGEELGAGACRLRRYAINQGGSERLRVDLALPPAVSGQVRVGAPRDMRESPA